MAQYLFIHVEDNIANPVITTPVEGKSLSDAVEKYHGVHPDIEDVYAYRIVNGPHKIAWREVTEQRVIIK